MMRIFIAGSTGVIGRRVVPLLVATGHQVTAVGRTPEKCAALERMGAAAVQVDLFDADQVRHVVAGHDAIINLTTSIPTFSRVFLPGAWKENDRIRRIVSANLSDAAKTGGVRRLIQESFAPAYADHGDEWIEERTALQPVQYNRSLLDAEAAATRFRDGEDIGVILRFAFFYGTDSNFTRNTVQSIRRGWAPVFGSTTAFMSSVSHDDAVTAVVAALQAGPGCTTLWTMNRFVVESMRSHWPPSLRSLRRCFYQRSLLGFLVPWGRCWAGRFDSPTASYARRLVGSRDIQACEKDGGPSLRNFAKWDELRLWRRNTDFHDAHGASISGFLFDYTAGEMTEAQLS